MNAYATRRYPPAREKCGLASVASATLSHAWFSNTFRTATVRKRASAGGHFEAESNYAFSRTAPLKSGAGGAPRGWDRGHNSLPTSTIFGGDVADKQLRRDASFFVPGSRQVFSQKLPKLFGGAHVALNQGDTGLSVETGIFCLHHPVGAQQVSRNVACVLCFLYQGPIALAYFGRADELLERNLKPPQPIRNITQ
jgi:hypothetical protein